MKKTKRLLTSVLAGLMLLTAAVPAIPTYAAEEGTGVSAGAEGSGAASLIDSLSGIAYDQYLVRYKDVPAAKKSDKVEIAGVDYDAESTTAEVSVETGIYGEKNEVLKIGVDGETTWTFDVAKTGMYNITVEYAAVTKEGRKGEITSGANNIERVLYINGEVPFSETRTLSMKKTWTFNYTKQDNGELRFQKDSGGSELRPEAVFVGQWEKTVLSDPATYYIDPFNYYFNEGTNSITLQGIREDMYIRKITLSGYEAPKSYSEVREEYAKKGYAPAEGVNIHLNAETPSFVSSSTITPNYDRSSAITEPQHPTAIMRNTIGGSSWSNTSDWVKYNVNIDKAGLYTIVFRFKQDSVPGSFVSRAVKIDGEYPFAEARTCTFDYSQEWQVGELSNGDTKLEFYLDKGEHEIELMVTVGSFGEVLTQVEDVADKMNDAYLQIVRLTGAYPDENRDYNFSRVMPEAIRALGECADDIDAIIKYIGELSGGEAYNIASLKKAGETLREMSSAEKNIAKNLTYMKSNISDLSNWCSDLESQPLTIDYMELRPLGTKLPEANAGFIDSMQYEIGQFVGSFYTNYNSFSDEETNDPHAVTVDNTIECWMSTGRDRATIIRDLVNSGFCDTYKINVSLKLVDGGALLPSVLAGIGPDISLDGVSTIEYAIRGAVLPLNDFENFDEICQRFYESTLVPNSLYGKTYALPTTVDFNMMFVRNDILAQLGLDIPKTWEDFLALIPVLQYNNMTVIVPNDYKMFLYQMGGDIWDQTSDDPAEHGWRVTYDDNTTLTAFTTMCNLFTEHSLLPSADFQTRFKTGTAPVAIVSYSSYTALTVFAPEIAGLWSMVPIPGTVQADGTINNSTVATAGGISMLKGASDKDAVWKFMCWYTDVDFQVDMCNELITLLGPAAKTTTANIAAMAEMPWSNSEYQNLMAQYENTVGIPAYPGNYVVERYTGMAFNAAYSDGENPAESLLQYVNSANNEITRKRIEFGMPTYKESAEDAAK